MGRATARSRSVSVQHPGAGAVARRRGEAHRRPEREGAPAPELPVDVRLICPEDSRLLTEAFAYTSSQTYYQRFRGIKKAFSKAELKRLCDVDGRRNAALIATDPAQGGRLAAVARYMDMGGVEAEMAVIVHDPYARLGLGQALLEQLAQRARANGFQRFIVDIRSDNLPMLGLLQAVWPDAQILRHASDGVEYVVEL